MISHAVTEDKQSSASWSIRQKIGVSAVQTTYQ